MLLLTLGFDHRCPFVNEGLAGTKLIRLDVYDAKSEAVKLSVLDMMKMYEMYVLAMIVRYHKDAFHLHNGGRFGTAINKVCI